MFLCPCGLRRSAALAFIIGSTVLVLGPGPRSAQAAAGIGCDLIVVLSNGRTVQMTATIGVSTSSSVKGVKWTLDGPAGTSVVNVTYTDSVAQWESFRYTAGLATGQYQGSVAVATNTAGPASVTTTAYVHRTDDAQGNQSSDVVSVSAGWSGVTTPALTHL